MGKQKKEWFILLKGAGNSLLRDRRWSGFHVIDFMSEKMDLMAIDTPVRGCEHGPENDSIFG